MAQNSSFEDDDVFFASLLDDGLPEGPTAPKQPGANEAEVGLASAIDEDETAQSVFESVASSVPPADLEFSAEDLSLRAALIAFYRARNPSNLSSINAVVRRFRSENIADLWAQLAVKYGVRTERGRGPTGKNFLCVEH